MYRWPSTGCRVPSQNKKPLPAKKVLCGQLLRPTQNGSVVGESLFFVVKNKANEVQQQLSRQDLRTF
jgi:hypothetical protein